MTAVSSSSAAIGELLASAPDGLPHVIVSDIGMPSEDGYDFIRQVRSLEPERGGRMPAVTMTGYATPEDVERALSAGFHVHVAKPIDPLALVIAVARLVRPGDWADPSPPKRQGRTK